MVSETAALVKIIKENRWLSTNEAMEKFGRHHEVFYPALEEAEKNCDIIRMFDHTNKQKINIVYNSDSGIVAYYFDFAIAVFNEQPWRNFLMAQGVNAEDDTFREIVRQMISYNISQLPHKNGRLIFKDWRELQEKLSLSLKEGMAAGVGQEIAESVIRQDSH